MPDTPNRVALVTGAKGGIGAAVARLLEARGAVVYRFDRDWDGETERAFAGDVSSETDWDTLAALITDAHGRLDVLVNNAGILLEAPLVETSLDTWRSVLDVNLTGAFLGCRAMVPLLRESEAPAILNVASIDGLRGSRNHAAYAASKGGMLSLTRALALELAGDGIRVNAICPGTVLTPMVEAMLGDAGNPDSERLSMHPLGRLSTPEEQAAAAVFLCSADASFVTGASLSVDGGRAIR